MKKLILASLVATMITAVPAWATTAAMPAPAAAATTQMQKEAAEAMQVATQGANAMRDIQFARLALFQGHPDNAKKLTDEAASLLADDSIDWSKFLKNNLRPKIKDDQYVMIDANVSLSEDYIASPEKDNAIKAANQKLAKGDKKGAVETLRLAGIDVIENQYLMPLKKTQKAVTQAQKLLASGKYYEANMVLKGAEDAIVLDSEMLVAGN